MALKNQQYLRRRRELIFSQTEELETARLRYLNDCEAIRRKYQLELTRLSLRISPALAHPCQ